MGSCGKVVEGGERVRLERLGGRIRAVGRESRVESGDARQVIGKRREKSSGGNFK